MSAATVTSKGQITIPSDIREEFGIEPGNKILFFKTFDDKLGIMHVKPLPDLGYGAFRHVSDQEGIQNLDWEINQGVADSVEQESSDAKATAA